MPAAAPALAGRSLLAIFAHPDDESLACGGLLARCASLGARVSLLCLTRGESGPSASGSDEARTGTPPEARGHGAAVAGTGSLAEIRTRELGAAAQVLGIADVVVLDHEDGMLPWADVGVLEASISAAIERFRPEVVITFGEDGLYWHPDHIAVHESTTSAVAALGSKAPALYYVTMPPGSMRAVMETAAGWGAVGGSQPAPRRILGIADVDAFGASAAEPTLVIEAGRFATRKLAALRCHRSQLAGDPLDMLSDDDAVRLLGTEHFRRADVGGRGEAFIERLAQPVLPRGGPSDGE